jgi:hypothetical protein
MTATPNLPAELYRADTAKGPRYYVRGGSFQGHRTFPVDRATAELAIAAGATVYRKVKGQSIWAERPERI